MFGSQIAYQFSDYWQGKPAVPRSPQWPHERKLWLVSHNFCAVCGYESYLNVHHKIPFHIKPEWELNPDNFITLGEACPTGNHHFLFGHLCDWRSWNEEVVEMANKMYDLIQTRPYSKVA